MDQTVVGVPAGVAAQVGDEVVVFGGAGDEGAPAITEVAALLDTIPYEVVTGISARVPRVYAGSAEGG